jgi:hypothetical protein
VKSSSFLWREGTQLDAPRVVEDASHDPVGKLDRGTNRAR